MYTALVWVGTFDSKKALLEYANHSKKKCPWCDDFPLAAASGSGTYQEAFCSAKDELRAPLLQLIYAAGYVEPVLAKLKKQKLLEKVNAVKVVYFPKKDADRIDTKAWPKNAPLAFLGAFDFDDNKTPMWHPERRTEPAYEQEGWVSIWIGTAESEEVIEAYMEEDEYDEEEDAGKPASKFGRDWKLCYDHDYLFHEGYAKPKPVKALLQGWNDAKSFLKPALAAADAAGVTDGNFVVVAYDLDYSQKPPFSTLDAAGYWRLKGKPSAKSPLKFIGAFPYSKG